MQQEIHLATDKTRRIVSLHGLAGTPQDEIAILLGISPDTLKSAYGDHLSMARAVSNASVCERLYKKAIQGDTQAIIFWLKTRANFIEKGSEKETKEDRKDQMANAILKLVDRLD
jgi:predicted alpha/beta-fold hydrolase